MERRLITTDCHVATPFSLLDELPASYRQYFPVIEERETGGTTSRPRAWR